MVAGRNSGNKAGVKPGAGRGVLTEDQLQSFLSRWLTLRQIVHFHVPNGGWRTKREAARFRGMGVKAGVHDLIILHQGKVLFVELKVGRNKQTEAQKAFDEFVQEQGHPSTVITANSVEDGLQQLEAFLRHHSATQ